MNSVRDCFAIFNLLPVPLAVHGERGNVSFFNRAFEEAFGYTTTDIPTLEAWWPAAYPDPVYRQRLATLWQQYTEEAKRTGKPFRPMEADVRCKDGSVRTVFCSAAPMEGQKGYHLAILHDITERKRVQQALLLKNLVFDQSLAANSISDREGFLTEVNKAFVKTWGYESQDEVIGKPIHDFLADPAKAEEIVESLLSSGQWEGDFSARKKDSSNFTAHGLATVVCDEAGEIVGFQSSVIDVSERQRVETLLEEAKNTAESANRAKSQFLANISHEIRTPITAIIGFTELLEDTELAEFQKNYLRTIATSSENLMSIVNDILDLSRIEVGKVKLVNKPFSIQEIIDEVFASQAAVAKAKKLALKKTFARDVPERLIGDPVRIKQILLNIVNNAIKFTYKGQVHLAVAVEERQPFATVLRFDVADSGIGIREEDLLKIFKPFSQVDFSTTRDYGGTGLGLAICNMLAALMGGEIWVDSQLGVGSSFHVRLPLVESDMASAPTDPRKLARRPSWEGRPLHVLLVEDSDTTRMLFTAMLKVHGHGFDIARNGAEALERWREGRYDIILMDVQMPVMDGFEAVERIRAIEGHKGGHVPVIALTAHATGNYQIDILKKGFDGYVTKPTTTTVLFNEMKRCFCHQGSAAEED